MADYYIEVKKNWHNKYDPELHDLIMDTLSGSSTTSWVEVISINDIAGAMIEPYVPVIVITNSGIYDIALAISSDADPARYSVVHSGTQRIFKLMEDLPVKLKRL